MSVWQSGSNIMLLESYANYIVVFLQIMVTFWSYTSNASQLCCRGGIVGPTYMLLTALHISALITLPGYCYVAIAARNGNLHRPACHLSSSHHFLHECCLMSLPSIYIKFAIHVRTSRAAAPACACRTCIDHILTSSHSLFGRAERYYFHSGACAFS